MDAWVKNLWNNNKILFFLLIPVVLLIWFRGAIINYLIKDSRKIENESMAKDKQLAQEESAAKSKADLLVEQANKLKNGTQPETDPEWYKK